MAGQPVTVAKLRDEIAYHRRFWPSNALGTAVGAVDALDRLINADPSEVFAVLDELRGGTR